MSPVSIFMVAFGGQVVGSGALGHVLGRIFELNLVAA